jgi:hypothetical protein
MNIAEIMPTFIRSTGGELTRHPEVSALVGELSHEVAEAEPRIDPALRYVLPVIDDTINDPRGSRWRHFSNLGRGDGHTSLPEKTRNAR